MARDKGLLNISANFEPQTAQPFDARMRVQTLADLTNATQWEANDGTVYAYVGMITVVYNDTTNNGLYRLEQADYTNISSWSKVGDGGTAGSVDWANIEGDITQNTDLQDALSLKEDTANKNQANGYVGLDANTKIDIAYIPNSALERLIIVADETARFALTTTVAQNGDVVKQQDIGTMFYIVDDTNLNNSNGYEEFAVGTAGAVEWSNVQNKPVDIFYKTVDTTDNITESANKVFVSPTEKIAITHTNRANLDIIDQDLATTSSPTFNDITISDEINYGKNFGNYDYYVDINSTATTKDGSFNKPYNSIQDCLTAIGTPFDTVDALRKITIHIKAGQYDESIIIPQQRMITFMCYGTVILGDGIADNMYNSTTPRSLTVNNTATGELVGSPSRTMFAVKGNSTETSSTHSAYGAGNLIISGDLNFNHIDGNVTSHESYLNGVKVRGNVVANANESGSVHNMIIEKCYFDNDFTLINANINVCRSTEFDGLITAKSVGRFVECEISGGITSAMSNYYPPNGFYNCEINGGTLTMADILVDDNTRQTIINNTITRTGTMTTLSNVAFTDEDVVFANGVSLNSTENALLLSRLTTIQRNALTPINGMIIYNSTDNVFQIYQNNVWENLTTGSAIWGDITGTLSNQTDLQTELDTKLNSADNLTDVADQQTALNNITAVSGATNEHVLTKDTATGNATWKEVISSDELLKVSSNDTTAGYLEDKIVGTTDYIVLTKLNAGVDEQIQIEIGNNIFDKSTNTSDDITEGTSNLLLTTTERSLIGVLVNNGDGLSYLTNDGTYKNVPTVNTDETLLGTGTSDDPLSVDGLKTKFSSITSGSHLIETMDSTINFATKIEYALYRFGGGYRTGIVKVLSDGIEYTISDNVDGEIGDTSVLTFTANMSGTDCLIYITNSGGFSYEVYYNKNSIGY